MGAIFLIGREKAKLPPPLPLMLERSLGRGSGACGIR